MRPFLAVSLLILLRSAPAAEQAAAAPAQPPAATAAKAPPPADAYRQIELLTRAMEMIRQNYVDESRVTFAELVEGALEGMLRRLDPHCEYMGRTLFEDLQREQSDTSEGVGITVALREGVLTLISVREDGPAGRAGVLAGDQIVRINEVLADSVGVAEAMQLLEGRTGEEVRLTLRRPGTRQFLEFRLAREALTETSVHDAMLLTPKLAGNAKIGYVRLSQFTQSTVRDLAAALDELEKAGLQALVLDVRNNPGGLLDSAVAVCGEFLPEGTVVVTTEGRLAAQNPPPYRTPMRDGRPPRRFPVAVLINHASASAAEIVAGALQDLKRALVVGTTSFGKGSVQSILPMKNGAAMRLTTAKYYTPSHRTIHEHGVTPDIVSGLTPDEEQKVARWRLRHGTGEAAAIEIASLGDRQLERAADALKGVLVFGAFEGKSENSPPTTKESSVQKP